MSQQDQKAAENTQENTPDVQSTYGGFDTMAQIESQARAHDQEQFASLESPQVEEQEKQLNSALIEAEIIFKTARAGLVPFFPCLAKIYTDDQIQELAKVSAPLMEKYGVTAGGMFDKWKHEITFAMTVAPLAIVTTQAIREEREERAAAVAKDVSNEAQASAAA